MKSNRMISRGQLLIATGATVIDDKEGVTDSPAAHALPCGISAAGRGPLYQLPKTLIMQEFVSEPYKYTNVVPKSANAADHRAEAFNRKNGTGLVGSYLRFCQRVLNTSTVSRGILDRATLRLAFSQLLDDYQQAFAIALNQAVPSSSGRVVTVPGEGTLVDLSSTPYSQQEVLEDNIRTSIRGQMAAMTEIGAASFSSMLVDEVESDFHDRLSESGE